MEQVDVSLIVSIIVMMTLSAFFSGMEIAYVSSNRMLAEMEKENGHLSRKIIDLFYRHPNDFVSTMLVGNNIVLVVYGILIARLFDTTIFSQFEPAFTVPTDTILSTIIVLFTGEFLPKTLFRSNPNRLLTIFAYPAFVFYIILWPISRFASSLSKNFLKMIGIKVAKDTDSDEFSKVDLDYLVQSSINSAKNDTQIDDEVKIFQNALDFSDTKVRDCMIPRTEINAIEMKCSQSDLMQKFVESGNSKLIIYDEDIDHVVGYIHSSELFKAPLDWHSGIRRIPFVPETMSASKMMQNFLQQKKSLGIVVDEFGGTSGQVALEDIVEEIFGEIEDEHDNLKYIAQKVGENEFVISARLEIDKVNAMFCLELPESEDYMTVGGLILHVFQSFPKLNELISLGKYQFKILKNTRTKIELVKLTVLESK